MANYRVKKAPIAIVAAVIIGIFGYRYAYQHGYVNASSSGPAAVPVAAQLPTLDEASVATPGVTQASLPSSTRAAVQAPEIRFQEMAWQAQTGINFANGGVYTTQGSLMQKHGVNLHIVWEDDVGKQMTALINFAAALKKGNPQPSDGAHFVSLMGDGSAAMIAGAIKDLREQGADPEVIGSTGYSRGEDKLMGPPAWKQNPKLARGGQGGALPSEAKGGLISGFLRDGDWNIALKWAGDNNIKNNPDEKTWDPDAINWYSADDFIKAADAYINQVCEDRPVVVNGKRTGDTAKVCVNAVVTWTPGDVNVAEQRGGLVSIVSTREYRSQMPQTIIGIKQWDRANSGLITEMLAAAFEGADQVKSFPQAAHRAFEANSEIYSGEGGAGRKSADYWESYFKGVTKADKQGIQVELGGSSVNNLNDNLVLYGMLPNSVNVFAATYTVFGNIVKQQYPKLVPDMLLIEKVLNTSYVAAVQKKYGEQMKVAADMPKFDPTSQIKQVVSNKAWHINFATGQATFAPTAASQLQELRDGLAIAGELAIEVHGHTDNTGNVNGNDALSRARAQAVKRWLVSQGVDADRFTKVDGFGSDKPVATNDTESGRAKNRRVEVTLGTN